MEVALDISAQQAADEDTYEGGNTVVTDSSNAAEDFLKDYGAAKIIVVIDTHSLENGYFVWRGANPDDLSACSLLEVSPRNSRNFRPNVAADPQRLHSTGGVSVHLQRRGHPNTFAQVPDHKLVVWIIHQPRWSSQRNAPGVGFAPDAYSQLSLIRSPVLGTAQMPSYRWQTK